MHSKESKFTQFNCPGHFSIAGTLSLMSSSSSSSSSNSPQLSKSSSIDQVSQDNGSENDSNSEENLIEALKKSLKLTNNKFLESEIEDLKEFFKVQLTELSNGPTISSIFWLKVCLPVSIRTNEKLVNEKPLISFKIELKSAVEPHDPENYENDMNLPYSITDFKVEELTNFDESSSESEEKEEEESNITTIDKNTLISSAYSRLNSILSTLLESKELSLLSVIEDFYIKLEESNYPEKEVICRDYYYPVFDCRHWGRSNFIKLATTSNSSSSNLFNLLAIGNSYNNSNTTSTITSTLISVATSSNQSISYRARALYDFQALMQGELSFQENEVLLVLANLGTGWLTARRVTNINNNNSTNFLDSDDAMVGLIPENYIERL